MLSGVGLGRVRKVGRPRRVALALSVYAIAAADAPEADACSPAIPGVRRTFPEDGATHPNNADILIDGSVLDPAGLSVTVDDQPASLVVSQHSREVDYNFFEDGFETLVLTVEPRPEVGQEVHVFGDICSPETRPQSHPSCWSFDLRFEAGAPDLDPPIFDLDAWYDVYDHESAVNNWDTCGGPFARYEITMNVEATRDLAEGPLLVEWLRRPRERPGEWERVDLRWRLGWDDPFNGFRQIFLPEDVEAFLPLGDAFCVAIRVSDLAGNPGPFVERCLPCHNQQGEPEEVWLSDFPSHAPWYTCESITEDGYCPPSVLDACVAEPAETDTEAPGDTDDEPAAASDTDDEPGAERPELYGPDRGCACSGGAPSRSGWSLAAFLLALAAGVRMSSPRVRSR